MTGRDNEFIIIQEAAPYIFVAIAPNDDQIIGKARDIPRRLALKLSGKATK